MRQKHLCLLFLSLFLFSVSAQENADREEANLENINLEAVGSGSFYSIPSPSEILSALNKRGVQVDAKRQFDVLLTDLPLRAKVSRVQTCFIIGRMFAVAGLSLKELSTKNLLEVAKRIHSGIEALELPKAVSLELDKHYQRFMDRPDWGRNELIFSFTEARASLVSLLKQSDQIKPEDRQVMAIFATSVEMGMWLQCLELALDNATANDSSEVSEVLLIRDILVYFGNELDEMAETYPHDIFIKSLHDANKRILQIGAREKLTEEHLNEIRSIVREVVL